MISFAKWRARRLLSGVGLSLCLAACGSGGSDSGGGTDGGTGGGGGNANESASLLADVESAADGTAALRVWDPTQPTTLVTRQSPVAAGEPVEYGWARSFDAASRTERQTARTLAVHTGNGRVWLTDLRGGQSHAPRQLSALNGVYSIFSVIPLALDGTAAWVNVRRAGPVSAVHSGMGSTDTPLRGQVLAALPDSTGAGRYIVVATSDDAGQTGLSVLAADGSAVGFSAISGGSLGISWVGLDPVHAGRAYVVVNQQLRRLTWTDSSVTLDARFSHDLQSNYSAGAVSDANGLWLLDGATLLHIVGDSVAELGTFPGPPLSEGGGNYVQLWDAGSAVVAARSVPMVPICCTEYYAMNKTTGTTTPLRGGLNRGLLFGAADGKALFRQTSTSGWSVLDMQGEVLSQGSGPILGAVFSAERVSGRAPALESFIACTADAPTGYCSPGPVSQFSLDGVAQLALGELGTSNAVVGPTQQAKGYVAGLPASYGAPVYILGVAEPLTGDLWQFTPGVAGSLRRVTQHVP